MINSPRINIDPFYSQVYKFAKSWWLNVQKECLDEVQEDVVGPCWGEAEEGEEGPVKRPFCHPQLPSQRQHYQLEGNLHSCRSHRNHKAQGQDRLHHHH